jgi:hypothetical protein
LKNLERWAPSAFPSHLVDISGWFSSVGMLVVIGWGPFEVAHMGQETWIAVREIRNSLPPYLVVG